MECKSLVKRFYGRYTWDAAYHCIPNDYRYYLPVQKDILLRDEDFLAGLSLEEIREKYGEVEAKRVYCMICLGFGDPTKPKLHQQVELEKREVFDWAAVASCDVPTDSVIIEYFLMPNSFTSASARRVLGPTMKIKAAVFDNLIKKEQLFQVEEGMRKSLRMMDINR